MTKKIVHGLLAVGLATSFSGCFEHELYGDWQGSCQKYDSISRKVYKEINEDATAMTINILVYGDTNCGSENKKITIITKLSTGEKSDLSDGNSAYPIDIKFTKIEITPMTSIMANNYNNSLSEMGCPEGTSFTVNVATDVSECDYFSQTHYDVASVSNDTLLTFGDTSGANDGSSSDKRPTSLSTSTKDKFIKVQK